MITLMDNNEVEEVEGVDGVKGVEGVEEVDDDNITKAPVLTVAE